MNLRLITGLITAGKIQNNTSNISSICCLANLINITRFWWQSQRNDEVTDRLTDSKPWLSQPRQWNLRRRELLGARRKFTNLCNSIYIWINSWRVRYYFSLKLNMITPVGGWVYNSCCVHLTPWEHSTRVFPSCFNIALNTQKGAFTCYTLLCFKTVW